MKLVNVAASWISGVQVDQIVNVAAILVTQGKYHPDRKLQSPPVCGGDFY